MNYSPERGADLTMRERLSEERADMGHAAVQDIITRRNQFALPEGEARGSKAYWNELARGLEKAEGWENHPVTLEARRIADVFSVNESVREVTFRAFVDLVRSYQEGAEDTIDLKRGSVQEAA